MLMLPLMPFQTIHDILQNLELDVGVVQQQGFTSHKG